MICEVEDEGRSLVREEEKREHFFSKFKGVFDPSVVDSASVGD